LGDGVEMNGFEKLLSASRILSASQMIDQI
jgi:hypothetical protein